MWLLPSPPPSPARSSDCPFAASGNFSLTAGPSHLSPALGVGFLLSHCVLYPSGAWRARPGPIRIHAPVSFSIFIDKIIGTLPSEGRRLQPRAWFCFHVF